MRLMELLSPRDVKSIEQQLNAEVYQNPKAVGGKAPPVKLVLPTHAHFMDRLRQRGDDHHITDQEIKDLLARARLDPSLGVAKEIDKHAKMNEPEGTIVIKDPDTHLTIPVAFNPNDHCMPNQHFQNGVPFCKTPNGKEPKNLMIAKTIYRKGVEDHFHESRLDEHEKYSQNNILQMTDDEQQTVIRDAIDDALFVAGTKRYFNKKAAEFYALPNLEKRWEVFSTAWEAAGYPLPRTAEFQNFINDYFKQTNEERIDELQPSNARDMRDMENKTPKALALYLQQHGFKELGSGIFSSVWGQDTSGAVVKVSRRADTCWLSFIEFAAKHKNKHLPKVGKVKVYTDPNTGVTNFYCFMERLSHINKIPKTPEYAGVHACLIHNGICLLNREEWYTLFPDPEEETFRSRRAPGVVAAAKNYADSASFDQMIDQLSVYREQNDCSWDLHEGNVMWRESTKTLVVTDPYS